MVYEFLLDELVLPPKDHPQYQVHRKYILDRYGYGGLWASSVNIDLKGKKILDVGVGSGGVACAFSHFGAEVVGIDVDRNYLRVVEQQSKDRNVKIELKLYDGETFPFKDETFDVVIFFDVLEHLPNPDLTVKEISRVLKKDGLVFIVVENKWFPLFILKGPHYGLPFIILFPRKLREFFVVKVTKRGESLMDYHWFGGFRETNRLFEKHGICLEKFDIIKDKRLNELLGGRLKVFDKLKMSWLVRKVYKTMITMAIGRKFVESQVKNKVGEYQNEVA